MNKKIFLVFVVLVFSLGLVSAEDCTETDGGDDPYVEGTVAYSDREKEHTDSDDCYFESYAIVTEQYCSSDGLAYNTTYYCDSCDSPTVCGEELDVVSYEDTDGGVEYKKGGKLIQTLTLTNSDGTVVLSEQMDTIEDVCADGTDLFEYYTLLGADNLGGGKSSVRYDCTDYGSSYKCLTNSDGLGYCASSSSTSSPKSVTTKASRFKKGAAELSTSGTLPWVLGIIGVLLIGGASYWYFTSRGSKKVRKK